MICCVHCQDKWPEEFAAFCAANPTGPFWVCDEHAPLPWLPPRPRGDLLTEDPE